MKLRLFVNFEFQDSISLPIKGFFSPFPHGTCSLSVKEEYLGFEGGPPIFKQESSLYFFFPEKKNHTGFSPSLTRFFNLF